MPGILVGIDGSHHSERALEWAVKEAAVRHMPLKVLIVHQAVVGWMGHGVAYPGDDKAVEESRETAREMTDKVLARVTGPHPESVTVEAVNGLPAEMLLEAAADADLLVVGSRGAGGFARLRLGSVSGQVAHHAHCPVVIVPHDEER